MAIIARRSPRATAVLHSAAPQASSSSSNAFASFRDRRRCLYVSCRLAVSEAWLALADFYYVAIGITHVAARLAVLFLWLCDKLGSSTAP